MASASFDRSVKDLQQSIDLSIPCVKVSTEDTSAKRLYVSLLQLLPINANHITETLIDLTEFTRDTLKDVELKLQVLWVTAQQVNARQKVEVSIRYCLSTSSIPEYALISALSEGFKSDFIPFYSSERRAHKPDAEYWRDLGQSSAFEGQILMDCIHRLHDDVLKVWNFNDPTRVSYRVSVNFFCCR